MVVFALWLGWSLGGALLAPGTDSAAARVAEWARQHELGWVVSTLEQVQYQLAPPRVGGRLAGGIPIASPDQPMPSQGSASSSQPVLSFSFPRPTPSASAARPTPSHSTDPAPIPSQVRPSLPSEGVWQTLVSLHGEPAIRAAFLRPDRQHTSYLVGVAWLDQKLVKLVLHPGYQVPGGSGWSQPFDVPVSERSRLIATFNSGFRMRDSNGGYWQDGKTGAPLRRGAASMVFYKDGHVDIVKWSGATPGPDVAAVRQNLVLLVDHGTISPEVNSQITNAWGATIGNHKYVWRTALGIRADGSLVFVVGDSMSVPTLANIVHAAGAVRAMELDINYSWTDFMTYTHPGKNTALPHMLTRDERPNPYRYLHPSSRDFVAVLAR